MLKLLKALYRVFRCIRESVVTLFFLLFVMVSFAFVSLLSSFNSKAETEAMATFDHGALVLNLNGYLADNREEYSDFYRLLEAEMGNEQPQKYSTFDVANAIRQAKVDEKITGLVLDLAKFEGGDYPSLDYLGKLLEDFQASGKPVIAIGHSFSQKQYYLASFADQIYLNSAGSVELEGLKYSTLYFKSLFDKIEATPYIFRVGTYKSAVEPLIRDDMSAEAKQNATAWLYPMWQNVKEKLAENRKISAENIVPPLDKLIEMRKQTQGNEADFALKQQFVTHINSQAEIRQALADKFGADDEKGFKSIDYQDYASGLIDRFNRKGENKIAVVNIEGEITMGESLENTAGADTIIAQLQKVKQDKSVRGLVLRINSPGGSALASELIRQEVEAIQKSGIPVVTSMGGIAASGGYWIAATSDKILADKNTLTGSIGIFGVMFNLEKTAKNLGIREDGITTSPLAEISSLKPLSEEQKMLIQMSVEQGYREFLDLVSRGRNIAKADIDNIAQGQVWLGAVAKEKGLVDQLGDFDDALYAMSELLKQQRLENKPAYEKLVPQWFGDRDESLFAELSRSFNSKMQVSFAKWLDLPIAKQADDFAQTFAKFNDPQYRYLYCLQCGIVN
ncbi:signal peptide peptidase SppA [uncultured Haemophilus sp.]|uniref:signal peptide peptidase SppA n=1 Tax=uncultured Haemophilus sp. TaxID=237779 RepID=UPI002586BD99|nr:signal peptide peptidase SppA [uncultured Haemophilus sp.]